MVYQSAIKHIHFWQLAVFKSLHSLVVKNTRWLQSVNVTLKLWPGQTEINEEEIHQLNIT